MAQQSQGRCVCVCVCVCRLPPPPPPPLQSLSRLSFSVTQLVLGIGLGLMVLSTVVVLVSDTDGEPAFEEKTPFRIEVQEGSKQVPMRDVVYNLDLPNDMEAGDPIEEVGRLEPVEPVEPVEQVVEEVKKEEDVGGGAEEKEHEEEIHQKISDQISEIKERLDQVVEENKLLKEKQDELEKKQQVVEGAPPEEAGDAEQRRTPVKEAPEEEGEIIPEHREVDEVPSVEDAAPTDDAVVVEGGDVPDDVIKSLKEEGLHVEEIESPKKDGDDHGMVAENIEVEGNIHPDGEERKESIEGHRAEELPSDDGEKAVEREIVEKREVEEIGREFVPEVDQLSDVQDDLPEEGVAVKGVAEPSEDRHVGRDLKNADGEGQATDVDQSL